MANSPEVFTHVCVRPGCGAQYKDNDPEAYYCPPCNKVRKQVAEQVDKKINSRPKKQHMSAVEAFMAKGKTVVSNQGGVSGFATFVKASDLM